MKTCATCGEKKSDRAFPADGRTTDNLSHICATCRFDSKSMSDADTAVALREFGFDDGDTADPAGHPTLVERARAMATWSSSFISGLPDSSFAYIEPGQGKDADGKTTPRSARHFPYKDADGNVDGPHVRNALSRVEQWKTLSDGTDVTDSLRTRVRAKLQTALDSLNTKSNADADGELPTVTLSRVDILSEGGPYHGTGSPPEGDYYTKADLEDIAAANRALAEEIKAANKLGHSKAQRLLANSGLAVDEQPAAGWLPGSTFRVEQDDGGKWKLYADIAKVPAKLAKLFEAGAFRTRSVELSRVTSQEQGGKVFDLVVTGLAWLGAKAPAVRTLDDICALYAATAAAEARVPDRGERQTVAELLYADAAELPAEVVRTVDYADGANATIIWTPETGFQDLINDLNAALNPTGGERRYWVQDVSINLDKCIVNDWTSNMTWVVPFTVDNGEPTPAPATDWELAEQAWVSSSDGLAERNFGRGKNRVASVDTDSMPDPIKKLSELSDDAVVTLAKTFGIEGADATELRPKIEAHLKTFTETPDGGDGGGQGGGSGDGGGQGTGTDDETTAKMAQLETDAALGRRAYEERRVEKRETLMQRALGMASDDPRIEPAQLDNWRKFYDENPELCEKQLALLPPLPTARVYGLDDNLPDGVKPEDITKAGEDAYAAYAASTGVRTHTVAS